MTRFFAVGLVAVGTLVGSHLSAVADYPERPITLIVPWGAGGRIDRWRQQVTRGHLLVTHLIECELDLR